MGNGENTQEQAFPGEILPRVDDVPPPLQGLPVLTDNQVERLIEELGVDFNTSWTGIIPFDKTIQYMARDGVINGLEGQVHSRGLGENLRIVTSAASHPNCSFAEMHLAITHLDPSKFQLVNGVKIVDPPPVYHFKQLLADMFPGIDFSEMTPNGRYDFLRKELSGYHPFDEKQLIVFHMLSRSHQTTQQIGASYEARGQNVLLKITGEKTTLIQEDQGGFSWGSRPVIGVVINSEEEIAAGAPSCLPLQIRRMPQQKKKYI